MTERPNSGQLFAPFRILQLSTEEASFKTSLPRDDEPLELDLRQVLRFPVEEEFFTCEANADGDVYRITVLLPVDVSLVSDEWPEERPDRDDNDSSGSDDEEYVAATAFVLVLARFLFPCPDEEPDDLGGFESYLDYMRQNSVSIAYGHARTEIMRIMGSTPFAASILPPLRQKYLCRALESQFEAVLAEREVVATAGAAADGVDSDGGADNL